MSMYLKFVKYNQNKLQLVVQILTSALS